MPLLKPTPVQLDSDFIFHAIKPYLVQPDSTNAVKEAIPINGISTDTRAIMPGCCFFALKGDRFNGNDFAVQAVEKGAVMCILSEEPKEPLSVPYFVVRGGFDTNLAYMNIAKEYVIELDRKRFFQGAPNTFRIAVTGSSGKTTVKDMITHILAKRHAVYCTEGNHNNHIGLPYTILNMPEDAEYGVFELGMNHKGEIRNLSVTVLPDLAVVTNIGTAHIGNLGSQEGIFRAKMEITEGMDDRNGVLVLPIDDPYLGNSGKIPFDSSHVFYSSRLGNTGARMHAVDIQEFAEETWFTVIFSNTDGAEQERAAVRLPMTGLHNVSNALLAISVAWYCGISLPECAEALADFVPTALRSDRVAIGNCTIIRDYYNANPEAMAAALQSLRVTADGAKTIAVLGNMNELGDFAADRHKELGMRCKASADAVFFCGVNHADFAAGYGSGAAAFAEQDDLIPALLEAVDAAHGEPLCILIKASRGMHMERVFDALSEHLQ